MFAGLLLAKTSIGFLIAQFYFNFKTFFRFCALDLHSTYRCHNWKILLDISCGISQRGKPNTIIIIFRPPPRPGDLVVADDPLPGEEGSEKTSERVRYNYGIVMQSDIPDENK